MRIYCRLDTVATDLVLHMNVPVLDIPANVNDPFNGNSTLPGSETFYNVLQTLKVQDWNLFASP